MSLSKWDPEYFLEKLMPPDVIEGECVEVKDDEPLELPEPPSEL